MSAPSPLDLGEALRGARALLEHGDARSAERSYARILEIAPDNTEALNFLGGRALRAGQFAEAIQLLDRAGKLDPANSQIPFNLGMAYLAAGRALEARDIFARLLETAPNAFVVRLHYGRALELLADEYAALTQYFAAVTHAQLQGRWLNDATTPPGLRDLAKHAMTFAHIRRKALFEAVLVPLRERHGDDALRRAMKCLQIFLGELPLQLPDPRQHPKFLYFPDLPATTYFSRDLFPWYPVLEDNADAIREELLAVLGADKGLEPFLGQHSPEEISQYLGGPGKPTWDAFFFYRHGARYAENCARCPRTAAILDALPTLARIRDHAPEVCFSVLAPGTHILPHRGVTNTRLVTHLPLIVPDNCALQVGGEVHVWQEGRCITFDDTFEHEAWNRSDRTRVVMLLDVWNPFLSAIECEAVTQLVEAIGDFNNRFEVSTLK